MKRKKRKKEILSMKKKYLRQTYAFAVIILLFFFSCSRFTYRIMYDNLDFILYQNVNKYFIPNDSQKEFVRGKLFELLEWNRKTALPGYKKLFSDIKKSIRNGLTKKDINNFYERFDSELLSIADKAAPDAADFVLTLDDRQLENFRKVSIKHKEEESKKDSESGDQAERRAKSAIRFLSEFYGDFSDEQVKKITEFIKNSGTEEYDRWKVRDFMRNEFIQLAQNKSGKEQIAGFIKGWLAWKEGMLPETLLKKMQEQRQFNISLYLFVDKEIVTEKQRENAVNALERWIEVIDTLYHEKR